MAQYTVQPSQNLFDVAMKLYGSIEGIFDLLISNKWLNMESKLTTGMVLEYHEEFVVNQTIIDNINSQGVTPANSERHVYFKSQSTLPVFIILADKDAVGISFVAGGEGNMIIDWGDNTDLEIITLSHENTTYEHYYDNVVDLRRVKVYGDFAFTYFDSTNLTGPFITLSPICVDEFVSKSNGYALNGLFLFEETYSVSLRGCNISDLSPIADMSLQTLDLTGAKFDDVSILDDYLEYIVSHYENRRGCIVTLTTEPTSRGMAAINTIINEEAWNTPSKWTFIINKITYTA